MLFQFIYAVRQPSGNAILIILTKASHLVMVGYLSQVASHNHVFSFSSRIPNALPGITVFGTHTSNTIYSSLDRPSGISTLRNHKWCVVIVLVASPA